MQMPSEQLALSLMVHDEGPWYQVSNHVTGAYAASPLER